MRYISLKITILCYFSLLSLGSAYGMEVTAAGIGQGAADAISEALTKSGLPESLTSDVSTLTQNTMAGAFANVDSEALEGLKPEFTKQVFSTLGDEVQRVLPPDGSDVIGITVEQAEGIGNALRKSINSFKDELGTAGDKISDAGIQDFVGAINDQVKEFNKEMSDLEPVAEGSVSTVKANQSLAESQEGEVLKKSTEAPETPIDEEATPAQAEAGWLSNVRGFLFNHIFMGLVSAFIFMAPNWIMGAIQAALSKQAQLATQRAPQYIGGMWIAIPEPLIDTDDPTRTFPIYSRVVNPDAKAFYGTISHGLGEWAGADAPRGLVDNANFFVTSGSYDDCKAPFSWGAEMVTSPNFAGQMLHLNSGLEFLGNSLPLNNTYPYRQLTPLGQGDALHGRCTENIISYLELLGGRLEIGQPFVETYDMNSGTGIFTTQGSLAKAQSSGSAARDNAYLKSLGQVFYATKNSPLLATSPKSISQRLTNTSSALGGAQAMNYLKSILPQNSTFEQLSALFNVGPATVRVNNERVSGGFSLQAIQKPPAAVLELLGPQAQSTDFGDLFDSPPPAQNIFVYQTADTPWAVQARKILKSRGSNAADQLYDYIVCFDDNNTYIPGIIPQIQVPQGGASSKKPASITWVPNPNLRYLYSPISKTTFTVTPQKLSVNPNIDFSKVVAPTSQAVSLPGSLWTVFNGLAVQFSADIEQGPFQYGSFILSIPPELKQAYKTAPVYACTPQLNKNRTTLEGGFTDYLVPVDTYFLPVVLPSPQHAYFISLVTSRIYDQDLTLVSSPVDFSILVDSGKNVYVGTPNIAAALIKQGAQAACARCQDLRTSLGTLYQEYDLNPYNQEVLSILPEMIYAIVQHIQSSADPVYASAKSAGVLNRVAAYTASRVVSSLQALGLTPVLVKELITFWGKGKQKALDSIGAAVATSLTSALSEGISRGSIQGTLATASPNELNKLLASTTNSAVTTAFANIGSHTLKSVLPASVQPLFDSLAHELGIDPGQSYQLTLAQSGLIPTGALYLYTGGLNLGPAHNNERGKLSDYIIQNFQTINTAIQRSHLQWKLALVGQQKSNWLLYQELGPFAFTTSQIPNILIQAVSLQDLKQGDFVYQSPSYPGDYFIVASQLGSDNSVGTLEPFDAANPQPYLISLVTGTIYYRDPDLGTVGIFSNKNDQPQKVANLNQLRTRLKSPKLRAMLNVETHAQQPSAWKRYTFANFLLTIDPKDIAKNTYVYQDITTVNTFPPKLSQITDFFVGVQYDSKGYISQVGVPLESNPSYIISVITGTFYNAQGPQTLSLPSMQPSSLLGQLPGTLRPELRRAIEVLISKQHATQPPSVQVKAATDMSLAKNIVDALLSSSVPYLKAPYDSLKFYKGKYYGVTKDTDGTTIQAIFDYGGRTLKDAKGRSYSAGILYDNQGYAVTVYEGLLLDIMRTKAGVIVNSDGSQVLGVPSAVGSLDLQGHGKFYPFNVTAKLDSGLYTLMQYINSSIPGDRVFAHFQPAASGATPYYIDLYTGSQFTLDGKARIAQYPVRATKEDIVIALGTDAKGQLRFFGRGPNGYYYYYAFYKEFVSRTTSAHYTGFQAVGDASTYAAVTPVGLPQTANWTVKVGQLSTLSSGDKTIAFTPQGVFKSDGSSKAARMYTYIGSGPAGSPVFEGPKVTWDPNYAHSPLITTGVENGGLWSTQSLFISSLIKDQRLTSTTIPLAAYIECQAGAAQGAGKLYNALPLPGGENLDFGVTFYDNLIDRKTGAHYVGFEDSNGIHFYTPEYQATDASTLQSIQAKTNPNAYVSLTAYGNVGLFSPLPNVVNLEPVKAVLNVPKNQASKVQQAIINSGNFLFDTSKQRFLYRYGAQERGLYVPATTVGATYVDLRLGVLYNASGIPIGSAITYPQLLLLLSAKGIAVPTAKTIKDGIDKHKESGLVTQVPQGQALPAGTPFLLYMPSST